MTTPINQFIYKTNFGGYRLLSLALLGLTLITLTACATRPISNTEAIPVPVERILDSTYSKPAGENGEITIKRDSGMFGGGCTTRVFLNAKPIADVRASEKVVLYLPPSEYIIAAWPLGICGGGMAEVSVKVRTGDRRSFRMGVGSSGNFSLTPTAF